jgi:hypothetical protein
MYVDSTKKNTIAGRIADAAVKELAKAAEEQALELGKKEIKNYVLSQGFDSVEALDAAIPDRFKRKATRFMVRFSCKGNYDLDVRFKADPPISVPRDTYDYTPCLIREVGEREREAMRAFQNLGDSVKPKRKAIKDLIYKQISACKTPSAIRKKLPDHIDIVNEVLGDESKDLPAKVEVSLAAQINAIMDGKA